MTTLTLDQIVHRDRVYHLRDPITLHVTNDEDSDVRLLWISDDGQIIIDGIGGGEYDVVNALNMFAENFSTTYDWDNTFTPVMRMMVERVRSAVDCVQSVCESNWAASVIAANRERGGVAAIHGQVPAEETDAEFVRQVTEPDARDRRERAMMRLLVRLATTRSSTSVCEGFSVLGDHRIYDTPQAAVEAAIQEEMDRER